MKILLIAHRCDPPYSVFPYGIGYITAALEKAGHKVTIFDQSDSRCTNKELYLFLKDEKPFDFVGLGFQAAYFHIVEEVARTIKDACPEVPFLLGGSAPSASPEYLLDKFNADYVLSGEADETIVSFTRALAGEIAFDDVAGLCWRQDGEIKVTSRQEPPRNLDEIEFPAWDNFDMKAYTFPHRQAGVDGFVKAMGVMTSRGCPYTCKFCYRLEKGCRWRTVENCLEEIRVLMDRYDVNFIVFHDDLFMLNKRRVLEFCQGIEKSGLRFNWSCNGRFNIADREQIRAMKKAGCVEISYGLESGDQKILDEMDKRITVEQILEVAAMTKEEGVLVAVPSMFGLPGESCESLAKTVDAIISATSWHDKRTVRPMQPYPGCPYWFECIEQGLLKDEDDFYSRYFSSEKWTVNMSDVADSEFDTLLYEANKKLLAEHYKHKLQENIQMFEDVYFQSNAKSFVPMR